MKYSKCVSIKYVFLFILVLSFGSGFSQGKGQSPGSNDIILNTTGLHNEELFRDIFLGNFLDIPFDRDVTSFSILLNEYITVYSERCGKYLPADKVQLTYRKCVEWDVFYNYVGIETRRECTLWKDEPIEGSFASPEMHYAKSEIEKMQNVDATRTLFKMITQNDPFAGAMNLVGELTSTKQDMATLFEKNDCNSSGLKRFEENLRLFALNKQPIVWGGGSTPKSNLEILSKDQNLEKLVDDLIYQQSTTWVLNKYERSSASNVSISSRDSNGLPSEIQAAYLYQGWLGRSNGTVRITFTDGLPECLYFFDYPNVCRTADRKIVASYAGGSYQMQ